MSDTDATRTRCAKCEKPGSAACNGCRLVAYCGRDCQVSHWREHKADCKSLLAKDDWQPQWVNERRAPVFQGSNPSPLNPFGIGKHLWGNLPAIDIVKLAANEGQSYDRDMYLLFAASGDLRNVITSINALPAAFKARVSSALNDKEFDVVARNLIILLIALAVPDKEKEQAIECTVHLWFSAFVRQQDMDLLEKYVLPLVEDVVSKTSGKAADSMLGKSWTFEKGSCRAVLTKCQWDLLPSYLKVPNGLTAERAQTARKAVTLAPHRQDYRDRWLSTQPRTHRVPQMRFREDGIVLPFGYSRKSHSVPNPTFFQNHIWPMKDSTDPMQAWSLPAVLATSGLASNDLYGKLFFFLREQFAAFYARLRKQTFEFTLYHLDAAALRGHLPQSAFARIEVSNISDANYLGVERTVAFMSPLLQAPKDNPSATLITLFMNAVPAMIHTTKDPQETKTAMLRALQVNRDNPMFFAMRSFHDPKNINMMSATDMVRDFDHYFDLYMHLMAFDGIMETNKVQMKGQNTIIDKWPLRLKLSPGQAGAKEEFDVLMASECVGHERYVEWSRKM